MGLDSGDELLCIVFTDLVGWTEMGDRIGDDAADALRREHFTAIRVALETHRGREIKTAGDSMMATFRSALDALRCAVAIQDSSVSGPLQVRVGVHAGEPIADEGDVFGTSVNIASRLCAAAGPGEVLMSELTRSLLGRRGGFDPEDVGPLTLKGLREPVRAFRLRVGATSRDPASAPTSAPPPLRYESSLASLPPERTLLCPVVVGRDRELAMLSARVEASGAGQGGVVALIGEPGVGKTRLSQETSALARSRAMTVLSGRAVPGASPVPYRPLTEAFLAAFRSSGPPQAPELTGFSGHLGKLVPEWRSDGPGGADESPVLLGEAVVRLLRILGREHGCLLLLEDLHWADVETLAVVDYLADALRDEPLLCLCTARPTGAATGTLARLRRQDPVAVIGLSSLPSEDIDRVVTACLDTDSVPHEVFALIELHSEGNPFLIEELLAGLAASGALTFREGRWTTTSALTPTVPFDFGETIQQRLSTLDDTTRRVVGAAALLGRRFDWELLPGVAEVDGRAVVDSLRRAVHEQLIEVEGSEFKFRHALTREAVLAELLPPERKDLARRAWPAVERAHPGLPGPWCELAADLAEMCDEPAAAAKHLVECAHRAVASGALASAEATALRARTLAASDPAVLADAEEVLVQTLALAGKPEQAAAIGDPLVDRLTESSAPADRQANVLILLARAALAGGDATRAATKIERARDLISRGSVGEVVAARVEAVAAHVALEQVRLADADAIARSAAERAAATGQPAVECEALEVIGRLKREQGTDQSAAYFERAAALAEKHGLTNWNLRARHELALLRAYTQGDLQPLRETRDLAARQGALVTVAVMDLALAETALGRFDRDGCLEAAHRCVEASRRYRLATLPVAHLWLAGGFALADQEAEMEAAAARALEPNPEDPRILGDLWGRVRATLSIVRGDRERLRRDLDTMMEFVRVAPVTTSIFPNRILWALIHTVDDDDHGVAARAELAAAASLRAWPVFGPACELIAAVAQGRDGESADATARFAAASDQMVPYGVAAGVIHCLRLYAAEAAIRDGWGNPATWAREAEAYFSARGHDRIARWSRSLLANAGAPVPRRGRGDSVVPPELRALGITSRELDVLKLVADGLSNREIAERLVVSPKTVERHVTSLFDRTGIRNRVALGEFARTQSG